VVLTLLIVWIGGAAAALVDGRRRWVGVAATLVLLAALALMITVAQEVSARGHVETITGGWPPEIGIRLRVDRLSVILALSSISILLVSLLYQVAAGVTHRVVPAATLFLATGLTGLFWTADVFNFYVFFEISMAASFVLVGQGEEPQELGAAFIFMAVNLLGSTLFLVAVAAIYYVAGTLDMAAVGGIARTLPTQENALIGSLVLAAFGMKLGIFPFHMWVRAVYGRAHPAVAAVLSGALATIGSYGVLRFGTVLFSRELAEAGELLILLGGASAIYGGCLAVSRVHAGEVLAYSSVAQVGFILIALGIGGRRGLSAAALFAVGNAMTKALLFLAAPLGGRVARAAFLVGALSLAGMPLTLGFVAKLALLEASVGAERPILTGVIVLASVLTLLYVFPLYQRLYWAAEARPRGVDLQQGLVAVLALIVVGLGVWADPVLSFTHHALSGSEEGGP
jgi:multicomponent Na+:H+ antiporter subunit D